ncbi:hypothetical protein M011DRAFT_468110 [Sporormia fimetaria CBS 119925]|uniref:Uncharacterized protein n=1 Tax=Sporormia fimetaria CBS 119925 TaxID=1340428 RepID=A0A6A6V883_9PLEO|nr:hypothetical protein M011DRAFT_468110 [Sporormia fimetaria CBS 119925]
MLNLQTRASLLTAAPLHFLSGVAPDQQTTPGTPISLSKADGECEHSISPPPNSFSAEGALSIPISPPLPTPHLEESLYSD